EGRTPRNGDSHPGPGHERRAAVAETDPTAPSTRDEFKAAVKRAELDYREGLRPADAEALREIQAAFDALPPEARAVVAEFYESFTRRIHNGAQLRSLTTIAESQRAAAPPRHAQAHTLVRIYRGWGPLKICPATPTAEDRQAVMRDHPDLVAAARWDGIVTTTIADWLARLDVDGVYESARLREDFERLTGHTAPAGSEVILACALGGAPPPIDQAEAWGPRGTYGIFVVDAIRDAGDPGWKHSLDWAKARDDCERVRQLLVEALRWDDL